ncbi:hypothetical protein PVL29_015474 [Vitis rotundifolia]|uniref:O-methyltransferase C-terminal domain-containing protein n=1 Tax=Vitis rotundifolia TaxID=103349 RepID=A0AA38ZCR1_VITRO|nr:hypothetical protein PVL29_015474 [Vitis rotundifolia]
MVLMAYIARLHEGGIAFEKAHGRQIWNFALENPVFNNLFNDGMACTAKITMKAVVAAYKDGFGCIGTLVDVEGGTGGTGEVVAELVKAYPHIKGINFDLPCVLTSAPAYERVSHVEGDMFESIPKADAIFMKWILHDWNDEDCFKILKNCRKAVLEKTWKIIIVDGVIREDGDDPFDETRLVFDLVMVAHSFNGKERTEVEWKKLLEEGGFTRYRILKIATLQVIIEAYPE